MFSDLRYAIRQFLRAPGFTLVAILSLALGLGATATVFSWIRHILLEPVPGAVDQSRLAVLVSNEGGGGLSLLDLRDFNDQRATFAGVAGTQITPASLTVGRSSEWIYGQVATANLFDVLGIKPVLGRTFLPDEDRKPGGDAVIVLGENLWRRRFAADPAVIGRTIEVNRHAFTVIGVAPAAFRGTMTGLVCEFWTPVTMVAEVASWPAEPTLAYRQSRPLHNIARLAPGVTVAQAQAAVDALDRHLATAYPKSNRTVHHRLARYADCPYGAQAILGPVLKLLLAVSFGVLLIVAANITNLLLARAASRQREIAIRLASGASRARLLRQLLTESVLLAVLGGAAGLLVASWTVDGLGRFMPAMREPIALGTTLDSTTVALTAGLTLVTGLLFGLVPAFQSTQPRLYETLKEGGRGHTGSRTQNRLRATLVVAEVALALMLLVGAGLCLRGLDRARRVDIGLQADRVLVAGLKIGMQGYNEQTGTKFYDQLRQRLTALPGVESAALATWFPLGLQGCKGHGVEVEGYVRPDGENPTYEYAIISPDYFATLGIPLVAGRDFTFADDRPAPRVAIVNEAFAAKFWPGQDALGRKFRAGGRNWTIIGLAHTGKYHQLDEPAHPFFYLPYRQHAPDLDLNLCVRTAGEPLQSAALIRQTVRELDPGVDVWGTLPLNAHIQGALFVQRLASQLLTGLGVVALTLAAMGVYAVMAYAVSQRTQEFGVRMALGARPLDVIWQVVRRGLVLALAGAALGLGGAAALTRLLGSFLYGISPFDPLTFAAVPLVLIGVAVLACWLPALRATRVDPMTALRRE